MGKKSFLSSEYGPDQNQSEPHGQCASQLLLSDAEGCRAIYPINVFNTGIRVHYEPVSCWPLETGSMCLPIFSNPFYQLLLFLGRHRLSGDHHGAGAQLPFPQAHWQRGQGRDVKYKHHPPEEWRKARSMTYPAKSHQCFRSPALKADTFLWMTGNSIFCLKSLSQWWQYPNLVSKQSCPKTPNCIKKLENKQHLFLCLKSFCIHKQNCL